MTEPNQPITPAPRVKTHGLSFMDVTNTARALKARGAGYTRLVTSLRVALPVLAALVLLALFIWPYLTQRKLVTAVMNNLPDLVIDNLNFTGLDTQNQPYAIRAVKATRVGQGAVGLYDLDNPQGEMTLNSGENIAGQARLGRLDEGNKLLWLGGDVHITHNRGYAFTTDEAQVNMQTRSAWGEKPVEITGDFGKITGNGFQLHDAGSTLVVKGPAKAVLKPASTPKTAKEPDLHPGGGSGTPVNDLSAPNR